MPKPPPRAGPGAPPLHASVAELRALAHPLRLRILELFAESPRTTKQVAELLGEPPTRLYHHVAALERAGLLTLRETRKNRGTIEKWFETPTRMMGATSAKGGRKGSESQARRAAALTVVEQSKRELLDAMTASGDPPLLARIVVAAPSSAMAAVRQRLMDLIAELRRENDCDDATPNEELDRWALTMSFAPVSSPGHKRRTTSSK
jgi:DNA-binding transcriptional ArsR family regulator